jgi:hypothetical protein
MPSNLTLDAGAGLRTELAPKAHISATRMPNKWNIRKEGQAGN